MAGPSAAVASQVVAQLKGSKFLIPSQSWLQECFKDQRPATTAPALYQTALFRLLASDITQSLEPVAGACLPSDVHNATLKERRLQGPIVVQILDVEDMGRSRWDQIEAIEALERGEGTIGREIIRVIAPEDGGNSNANATAGRGPHKLLLQDTKGSQIYGIELKSVSGVFWGMSIGSKLALRNVAIARGVLLLEPGSTTILGGKIEGLHHDWTDNRKARLKAAIEAGEART